MFQLKLALFTIAANAAILLCPGGQPPTCC